MIEDDLETIATTVATWSGGALANITAPFAFGSKASVPEGVGPFVMLRATGGTSPTYVQNDDGPSCRYPAYQLMVYCADGDVAVTTATDLFHVYARVHNLMVGPRRYRSTKPLQEPMDHGLDAGGKRARVAFNLIADISD